MQNGVSVNNNRSQKPLTQGEVAPKATERATSRASSSPAKNNDPFLEGFYSVEDKPETKKKTYLQHRDTPSVQKPQAITLPYRPSLQGQPKITKLPYIPAQSGTPKVTQYGQGLETPSYDFRYINNQNLLGDIGKKEKKDPFLEGFNDPYGEKRGQEQLREAREQRKRYSNVRTSVNNRTLSSEKTTDPFLEGFNEKSVQQNEREKIKKNREEKENLLQRMYVWQVMNTTPFPNNILRARIGRALEEHVKEKHYERNKHNVNLPQNQAEAIEWGWEPEIADCHQNTAKEEPHIKYVSPDGKHRENIFNNDGDEVITAVEDEATYNYASPDWPLEHGVLDILPWIRYGNKPEDPTTWNERIGGALGFGR